MKKAIIIVLLVIVLIAALIWGYLMFFGRPASLDDVWANFGFGDIPREFPEEQSVTEPDPLPTPEPTPTTPQALRRLSDNLVAGAAFISDDTVRYVQQGTGYIYHVNTDATGERRVSDTTYALVESAVVGEDGIVVLQSKNTQAGFTTLLQLTDSGAISAEIDLPRFADNIGIIGDTVYYTLTDDDGTLGYAYNTQSGADQVVFTVPFIATSVIWGDEILVYNRPDNEYLGYVYTVETNRLTPVTTGGNGLMAERSASSTVVVSYNNDGGYSSYVVEASGEPLQLGTTVLPQKCSPGPNNTLWCAYPFGIPAANMPSDWLQGLASLDDILWQVDLTTLSSTYIAELPANSARNIDAIDMQSDASQTQVIFRDKNSNLLWLYDTTITQ